MANPFSSSSRSPPPLQHPVPTHPAFIPDPPSTPSSPDGYMRFTSTPPIPQGQGHDQGQQQQQHQNFYQQQYAPHHPSQQQQQFQQYAGSNVPPGQQRQGAGGVPPDLNFAQWGVNPATAQLGFQLGQSAMAAGQDYVQKNVRVAHLWGFPLPPSASELTCLLCSLAAIFQYLC